MSVPLLRPALPEDAGVIAALMQSGMSAQVRRLTILGSPLLERYVAEQIGDASGDPFLVAVADGRVVGIGSWRRVETALFLNHLYVLEEMRGRGLGRALFEEGLRRFAGAGVETIAVDVFSESKIARAWYGRLGLTPQLRHVWIETPLPPPRSMSDGQCTVAGMEEADREHAARGFSHFTLNTFTAEYTIGRLAEEVFRFIGFGLLQDRPALAGLAALDARRVLICVGAPEELPPESLRRGRIVAESERLAAGTRMIVAQLE